MESSDPWHVPPCAHLLHFLYLPRKLLLEAVDLLKKV